MSLTEFHDRLAPALTLTVAGKEVKILGGDVRRLDLFLRSDGFTCEIEFDQQDDKRAGGGTKDELLQGFPKPDLMLAKLELRGRLIDDKLTAQAQPISVTGVVQDRWLTEIAYRQVQGAPVLVRRYGVRFADPAHVLWRQHYPNELYTKKSMKDVLGLHKGEHIPLDLRWPVLDAVQPMIYIGLDPAAPASFYDWLLWYVDGHAGVWSYNYKKTGYCLTAEKDAAGTPIPLVRDDVRRMTTRLPEVRRSQPAVQNAYSEDPRVERLPQPQAAAPLREDHLVRTPISAEFDERVKLEKARHTLRSAELHIEFQRFPTLPLRPGDLCDFKLKEQWFPKIPGDKAVPAQFRESTLRLAWLHLRARADHDGIDADHGQSARAFTCTLEALLEDREEPFARLPAFQPPRYPRHVEGRIVSEIGPKEDLTYEIYTDDKTSLDTYKVRIPLWADQQVALPVYPGTFPGHFFFPPYKGQRVLVALEFQRAWIDRFLDWRPEARLPMDGQGNHLLLGKSEKSFTSVQHRYDEEKPVFHIQRKNDKDTAIIQISEGALMLRVKQED